jgi:hypothetical protein
MKSASFSYLTDKKWRTAQNPGKSPKKQHAERYSERQLSVYFRSKTAKIRTHLPGFYLPD